MNIQYNNFQDNSIALSFLFSPALTSIPIFSKVISDKEAGYFSATALMVRLVNYANIRRNLFDNNKQVALTPQSLTVGSAISIDRHVGSVIEMYYDNFTNH